MPCPTGSFKIISRGKGQSCMASCAYYSGEKKYSEYECCWKYLHSSSSRVKWVEVMLPSNAPRAYADPQTLWNAVDAAETSVNAQTARSMLFALPRELTDEQNLALVRDFCQKDFVDKGMVCNFFYHDKGDGNPHVHIMLTLRAMDENGKWLPKSKNVYALDENGNRIRAPNGSWKRVKVDTVDWNERKYGEIWRQDWATAQNAALEAAGRMERVDMSGRALKTACRKSISVRLLLRWNARAFPANAATRIERSSAGIKCWLLCRKPCAGSGIGWMNCARRSAASRSSKARMITR